MAWPTTTMEPEFITRLQEDGLVWILSFQYLVHNLHIIMFTNSPIGKVDIDGNWDIEIHLDPSRQKGKEGILVLKNRHGEAVAWYRAGGRGKDKIRTNPGGDTHTGTYQIRLEGTQRGWWEAKADSRERKTFGQWRLVIDGTSGEIMKSVDKGRISTIRIHASEKTNKYGKDGVNKFDGSLWNTLGCI